MVTSSGSCEGRSEILNLHKHTRIRFDKDPIFGVLGICIFTCIHPPKSDILGTSLVMIENKGLIARNSKLKGFAGMVPTQATCQTHSGLNLPSTMAKTRYNLNDLLKENQDI